MTARHKTRLAIGFFSGAAGLTRAVEDLISAGITTTRINLLSTLDSILPAAAMSGETAPIAAAPALTVREFAEGARTVQPTYERAMAFIAGLVSDLSPAARATIPVPSVELAAMSGSATGSMKSPLDRHVKRLADHLLAGGTIVVVHLLSPEEHQRVCTTLLQHSGNDVQTHELTLNG